MKFAVTLNNKQISNSTNKPQVLLVANTSWYLYNFRLPLIHELNSNGYKVALAAPHDSYTKRLISAGVTVHPWLLSRSSINPISEIRALIDLARIYRREKPELVHHFTIKACLYGTIAAKITRVYRVVNSVTGLGHVFLGNRARNILLRKFLKPIYKAVFMAKRGAVVFQNADDQERLIQLGITDPSKTLLIKGSGVDINHFSPISDSSGRFQEPLQILFPSRIIREKGIIELLEACQSLWKDGFNLELLIAGDLDSGNPSSLSTSEIELINQNPRICTLGHINDMRSIYATSDLVVLPSWREGLSKSLIEAAAMERPIITTDVPGCRDVIDHGQSGLLIPLKNERALELAIKLMFNNPELARRFGKAARRKAIDQFQVSLVNASTIKQYDLMFER